MTPLQTLKALVELQEIDIRVHTLEKDSRQIPSRLQEIESTLSTRRAELGEEKNQLDEAELARRMLESDLKAEKEKIKKWESRLNEIKSNRDYQALSREIESARKANLGIEDEILQKMQEIEDLKISIAQKQEDMDQLQESLTSERTELEDKLNNLKAQIESERSVRQQVGIDTSSRYYRQYEMIRNRRDGVAVVPVIDEHCQGCHMGIPPQLYNIVLRGEEIETCPFCHRILYYRKALEELDSQ